ncbi:MAG: hypothetical protein U0176_17010 [Bacteroidia bacterium]
MITHAQDNELLRANGMVATPPTFDVPSVSAEEALLTVQARLGLLGPVVDGQVWELNANELVYAPRTWDTQGAPLEFRLCWRLGVLRFERYMSTVAYVDAYTGEILRWEPGGMVCSAGNALTLYNGWQGITTRWYNFLTNHYGAGDECRRAHPYPHRQPCGKFRQALTSTHNATMSRTATTFGPHLRTKPQQACTGRRRCTGIIWM